MSILTGVLLLKGQIYGSHKDKYRLLFLPYGEKEEPVLVFSKLNRTLEKSNVICQVKIDKEKDHRERYRSGTIVLKIGSTCDLNSTLTGLTYHYNLLPWLKTKKQEPPTSFSLSDFSSLVIADHSDRLVYSIDPPGCQDIDDAFSLTKEKDNGFHLCIYIAFLADLYQENVDYLNEKPFTFYFSKEKRYDMFDQNITSMRSLTPGQERLAMTLQIELDSELQIRSHQFYLAKIINKKQLTYDEVDHLAKKESYWNTLFNISQALNKREASIGFDSHQLIENLMVVYNQLGISSLIPLFKPILRVCPISTNDEARHYVTESEELDFLRFLSHEVAFYQFFTSSEPRFHSGLGIENYGHLTSPLRRAVDVFNQKLLYGLLGPKRAIVDQIKSLNLEKINEMERHLKRYYRRTALFNLLNEYSMPQSVNLIAYEDLSNESHYHYQCYWPTTKMRVKLKYLKTPDKQEIKLFKSFTTKLAIILINGLPRIRITSS